MKDHGHGVHEIWRNQLLEGLEELRAGDFDRAEQCFARAYSTEPARPEVCFALGRERLRRGRVQDAEELLIAAVAADPTMVSAAGELARCVGLYQGRLGDAFEVLDRADRSQPHSPPLMVVRAELALEAGDFEQASTLAQDAIEISTRDGRLAHDAAKAVLARVENQHGVDLAASGHLDQALFAFRRAANHDPMWAAPLVNQGAAFRRLGAHQSAGEALEQAVNLDPSDESSRVALALFYRDAGDFERATTELETALALSPQLPAAACALAAIYRAQGDPALAIEVLSEAVVATPNECEVWTDLGACWSETGDLERAEETLRAALALDPDHVLACQQLADVLTRQGRYLEAAKLAEHAQDVDPDRARMYLDGRPRLNSDE